MRGIEVEVSPEVRAEMQYAIEQVSVQSVVITTPEQMAAADEVVKMLKSKQAVIEKERKRILDPLNESLRGIRELFDRPLRVLDDKVRAISSAGRAFVLEQQRRAAEEQARLQREADNRARKAREAAEAAAAAGNEEKAERLSAKADAVEASVPVVIAQTPKVDMRSYRGRVVVNITNPGAVPRELCSPNEALVKAWFKANRGDKRSLSAPWGSVVEE